MLRLRRAHTANDLAPSIDMTPMIDMVFQLLIFFLLTSIFASRPVLDLVLPEAEYSKASDQERELHLSIQKGGRIFVNQEEVPMEHLQAALKKRIKKDQRKTVFLSADSDVPFQIFVTVLDIAQDLGLSDLAIVTRPKEGQP